MKKPETIAAWEQNEKPALIEQKYRKACFDAITGEIVCIAWAVDGDPVDCLGCRRGETESQLLATFFDTLQTQIDVATRNATHSRPVIQFIGHNIINFDLPYIWRRAKLLGVKLPGYWPRPSVAPWRLEAFDTMLEWAGNRGTVSLDSLCQAFGVKGKDGMSGDQVYDYWQAGRYDEIESYCRDDVMRVIQLHELMA
ncbi:MAG: hypothetical protein KDK05_20660 [Candidatus Competibacteraceae bacterium]|nr:hypothetical protein [Candidatus Competibacteraceae bacterium]